MSKPKFQIRLNKEQKEAKAEIIRVPLSTITGKAGSGKTLLACQIALDNLLDKEKTVKKVIITRPAVTAEEDLGFLKGGIEDKLAPYLYPLKKNFEALIGKPDVQKLFSENKIEIIPIGFLRGVTFVDTVVIVDETQNVSPTQLELIIGRLGKNSKILFTGDIRQTDLRGKKGSSKNSMEYLKELSEFMEDDMYFVELKTNHRHEIVDKALNFFEKNL